MTIFRSSAAGLALVMSACANGSPATEPDLTRIITILDYSEAAERLQRFAEARLDDRAALHREFASARFERSEFDDGPDGHCEAFRRTISDPSPSVYEVSICDGKVYASAGVQNP